MSLRYSATNKKNQHPKQPCAKNYSYDQFEHAYRTGYDSFMK